MGSVGAGGFKLRRISSGGVGDGCAVDRLVEDKRGQGGAAVPGMGKIGAVEAERAETTPLEGIVDRRDE